MIHWSALPEILIFLLKFSRVVNVHPMIMTCDYVCVVYVPPSDASYTKYIFNYDKLESLGKDLITVYKTKCDILICDSSRTATEI